MRVPHQFRTIILVRIYFRVLFEKRTILQLEFTRTLAPTRHIAAPTDKPHVNIPPLAGDEGGLEARPKRRRNE